MWPFLLSLLSDLYLWTHPILKFFFSSVHLAEWFHLLHTLCCVLVDVKMDIFACSTIFRVTSVFLYYLCFCIWTIRFFYIWVFVTSFSSSTKNCLIVRGFFEILLWNVPFCFGFFSYTAVDIVNCTFAGMLVSAAYDAVGVLVVFPVYGLENVSDGEDQPEGEQCQHTLLGFWSR